MRRDVGSGAVAGLARKARFARVRWSVDCEGEGGVIVSRACGCVAVIVGADGESSNVEIWSRPREHLCMLGYGNYHVTTYR